MLTFERGDRNKPKGHALLYFRDAADAAKLYATYVVVLPVSLDVVKYMPPILAFQAGELAASGLSAFAFPPIPEGIEGRERLVQLAEARDDDLLEGGSANPAQVQRCLAAVNDQVQEYAAAYNAFVGSLASPRPVTGAEKPELGVTEVLYQFMSDRDRLSEMTKLIGALRFALGGNDQRMADEALREVRALAGHLPPDCQAEELTRAAQDPSPMGALLAQLYLDRCYRLLDHDAQGVRELEERIRAAHKPK